MFKQGIHLHDDYLIFTSSFAIHAADAFKPVYIAYQFENAINTTIIRFYRTSPLLLWILPIIGQWYKNILYGMLL